MLVALIIVPKSARILLRVILVGPQGPLDREPRSFRDKWQ